MSVAAAATGSQGLWFVSRASGLVLLVLFSVVVVLGVATRLGSAPRRWPRFVFAELHRTLALFLVAFLALHVVTAILDPFVSIGWAATVLPFTVQLPDARDRSGHPGRRSRRRRAGHQPGARAVWASGPGGRCTGWPTWRGRWRSCIP